MQILFFVLASIAFLAASIADAQSSLGMREGWPIYRDAQGRFSPRRYVLINLGNFAVYLLVAWLLSLWGIAALLLALLSAARVVVSIHNRKVRI